MLEQEPGIRAVLMGGDGQKEPFLLLEANENEADNRHPQILDQIWPLVVKVIIVTSEEIRVKRKRIIIALSTKPFKWLGKGTVNRQETITAYHNEIAALESND